MCQPPSPAITSWTKRVRVSEGSIANTIPRTCWICNRVLDQTTPLHVNHHIRLQWCQTESAVNFAANFSTDFSANFSTDLSTDFSADSKANSRRIPRLISRRISWRICGEFVTHLDGIPALVFEFCGFLKLYDCVRNHYEKILKKIHGEIHGKIHVNK